ncbi:hypothetical protein G6F46_015582 [Rhizopus delemar]|nr:hypothetical protein G6F46_015582 [Rhizopus delemar]
MRLLLRDVRAIELDAAAAGAVVARDAIEGGGFAGAVGADQRVDAAALHLHGQTVDGGQAAELHGQALDVQIG